MTRPEKRLRSWPPSGGWWVVRCSTRSASDSGTPTSPKCPECPRPPSAVRASARLVCTAHSIPLPMAERSRYREQLAESARLVAAEAGVRDWDVVYQSRSGRPEDPWLEPDVNDRIEELAEHAALMKRFPDMEHDAPHMAHVKPGASGCNLPSGVMALATIRRCRS